MAKTCFSSIFAALFLFFTASSIAGANDLTSTVEKYYGQGAHAINAGNFFEAIQAFDAAEAAGSRDPRSYFLRGVAYLRSNDSVKADADFEKAAELEWSERALGYNIGEALQRIQGNERARIESFRKAAKVKWEQKERERVKQRYGKEQEEDRKLLNGLLSPIPAGTMPVNLPVVAKGDDLQLGITAVQPLRVPAEERIQKQQARDKYLAVQEEVRKGLDELFMTAGGRIDQARKEQETKLAELRKTRRAELEKSRTYDASGILPDLFGGENGSSGDEDDFKFDGIDF